MNRKIIATATFMGALAIVLGAFGAHGLKKVLTPEQLITFETGVKYQIYHALFLCFLALLPGLSDKVRTTVFHCVWIGVLFFSGSIYLLATGSVTGINFKPFGFITPIGGLLMIIGWMLVFIDFFKKKP
ncbi:MAG: DUF423 domain-containing protein [Bacteroidetes bacterium]|nr:DUF423 domain-containing protein [Bacteroidota bacterium]